MLHKEERSVDVDGDPDRTLWHQYFDQLSELMGNEAGSDKPLALQAECDLSTSLEYTLISSL